MTNIQLTIDNDPSSAVSQSGSTAQFNLNSTNLTDGSHELEIVATGSGGETAQVSVTVQN